MTTILLPQWTDRQWQRILFLAKEAHNLPPKSSNNIVRWHSLKAAANLRKIADAAMHGRRDWLVQ